ncbi:PAS domain S-box protein [Dehalobacterium formicoaceticum]|uniref:PAS domain S-box protein n=1 Tax=Dehalobacterium formicoaceticum TaxID=51515 RepID=UPI000B7EAEFA|nr:PAS domain S-box protein [Dehalobacterium formicoaceticum]
MNNNQKNGNINGLFREAETEFIRLIWNNTPDQMCLSKMVFDDHGDPINYLVLDVNPAFEKAFGLKRDQVINKHITELFPYAYLKWIEICGEALRSGESFKSVQHISTDCLWYEVQIFPLGVGELFITIAQDISARKKLENALSCRAEELENKEKEYLEIIDSFAEGTYIHDIEKGETYYSREWKKRLGMEHLSPKQVAESFAELIHPDDLDIALRAYKEACSSQRPKVRMEIRLKTDKGYIWVLGQAKIFYDAAGRPVKYIGTHSDITERKQAEGEREWLFSETEKQRSHLLSIMKQLPVGVAVFDKGGKPLLKNELMDLYMPRIIPSKDLRGIKQWCALDPEGNEIPPDQWPGARALRGDTVVPGIEFTYTEKDGQEHWITVSAAPLLSKEGGIIGGTSVAKDITERKRHEQQQTLLLKISNELAKLDQIPETMDRLSEMIAAYFGVTWCTFSELIIDPEYLAASYGWNAEGAISLKGNYRMRDFLTDEQLAMHNAGEFSIVRNTQTDPRVSAESCGKLGIMSFIMVPISVDGQWRFLLSIIDNKPREWRDNEAALLWEIANRIWIRLEHARAEVALRKSDVRKTFLLKLSDALRPLSDALEIQETAMQIIGEHLEVDRVMYYEITDDGKTFHIEDNYVRNGFPKVTGDFPVSSFGKAMDVLRRGEILVIEDQTTTPLKNASEREACTSLQVYASATVPLIKNGRWVANFGVLQGSRRKWAEDEIAILQDTAERTWDAVVRAKAEGEVRKARELLEVRVEERTKELAGERQRLLNVLETLPVSICLLTPDYHIPFANRTFRERFGDPKNRICYEFLHGLNQPCASCQSLRPLETGQPHNWLSQTPDGSIWDVYNFPFIDTDGSTLILQMSLDITEQRKTEAEMARLDRLNLIGDMAAGIGHEIRNPMTAVRGFLQILGERQEYQNDREYFDLMIEELNRANQIISEYLGLARNRVVNLQPRSIDKGIESLYPIIQSEANLREMGVVLDLGNPPEVLLDKNEMRQLIINMCRNAMEAMSSHGTLTIGTRQQGNEVILYIKDEGSGLSPEIMDKMGTPFLTTKEHGTGLGLAVCYSIAARHHARIDFETGPSGTTFYVRFPIYVEKGSTEIEKNVLGGSLIKII